MPKSSLVKEMIGQICICLLLKQSRSEPSNRLALIVLDNVVEVALRTYANIHDLLKKRKVTSDEVFSFILDKVKDQNKIVNSEKNDIQKYHRIRNELYRGTKLTVIKDGIIEEYVVLAKILLGRLYDFRASKLEWKKMVTCTKKNLI